MRSVLKPGLLTAGALLFAAQAFAIPSESRSNTDSYNTIVTRNPFGLKPPPPPVKDTPKQPEEKPIEFLMTGITRQEGRKTVYLMSKEQGKKNPYWSIYEGETIDGIQVKEINEKNKTARIVHGGVETLLSFDTHGVAPPKVTAPPPGQPGVQPLPGAIPPPGMNPNMAPPLPGVNNAQPNQGFNNPYGAPNSTPGVRTIPPRAVLSQPVNQPVNNNYNNFAPVEQQQQQQQNFDQSPEAFNAPPSRGPNPNYRVLPAIPGNGPPGIPQ